MRSISVLGSTGRRRAPRLWIVETLVVLGVLGFGYFALTLDGSPWSSTQLHAERSIDPLLELTR